MMKQIVDINYRSVISIVILRPVYFENKILMKIRSIFNLHSPFTEPYGELSNISNLILRILIQVVLIERRCYERY